MPQFKPFNDNNFGEVEGFVLPNAAQAIVVVYNNTDTAMAIPNNNGYFKVRGLNNGIYSVQFKPLNTTYQPKSLFNIRITSGSDINVGNVTLQ